MSEADLFDAIRQNDAARVASLLDADSSLLQARQNGITPILLAAYVGHAELARLFTDRGASLTFGEAIALGDSDSARRLLKSDASLVTSFTEDGFPAVGLAIFFRHPALARELIERGADVQAHARNAQRVAPVHAAAAVSDRDTMQLLLDRGANVNARQQLNYTALHDAAGRGDVAMIDLLLARGADAQAKGDDGKTPADLAAERGHPAIAERLRA